MPSKVLWLGKPNIQVTWESADALHPSVIEDYENGLEPEVTTETEHKYGQQKSVLTVNKFSKEILSKKPKLDRPVINESSG